MKTAVVAFVMVIAAAVFALKFEYFRIIWRATQQDIFPDRPGWTFRGVVAISVGAALLIALIAIILNVYRVLM